MTPNLEKGKGHRFKAGEEQRAIARAGAAASIVARRKKKERREVILSYFRSKGLTAEESALNDALLLCATADELARIAASEELPTDIRRRARILMGKDDTKAVTMAEILRDRAYGKPKQMTEVELGQKPPINIKQDEIE